VAYLKEEVKAGLIVVSSLVILSAFVILIGGTRFFEKFDTYYVKVKNAVGLEEGAQVKLGGVRIGRVISVREPVNAGDSITVKIGVKKDTPLYKGTKALITQIGFVGDIYLLLSVDKTTNERFKVGDTIPSDEQVQFTELMAKLDEISGSVNGLIKDVNALFSKKNIENVERLIENTDKAIMSGSSSLDKVAVSLKATTDKLEHVLVEVESLVKGNKGEVTQLIKKARENMEKASDMIRAFEETAKTVDKTAKSVDRTIDLQSQNVDVLLKTLTRTSEDLHDAMLEIKHKPWSVIYKEGTVREE
jgi:ABC-type transporter Mla subunit MlaD